MCLLDVSPMSQDRYALRQLHACGELQCIDPGRFEQAVSKCSNLWASLPGGGRNGDALMPLSLILKPGPWLVATAALFGLFRHQQAKTATAQTDRAKPILAHNRAGENNRHCPPEMKGSTVMAAHGRPHPMAPGFTRFETHEPTDRQAGNPDGHRSHQG